MQRLQLNKIEQDGKIIYQGYATKANGVEVDVQFTVEDLEDIIKAVEKEQTKEELKQEIVNSVLVKEVEKGKEVDIRVVQEWQENTEYLKNQPVAKFGVLYFANKKHLSDNQSNPIFDTETWRKEVKLPRVQAGENPEYREQIGSAKPWNRDESFKKDTYVVWYGELYKAKENISDNSEPGKSDKWEIIPKLATS